MSDRESRVTSQNRLEGDERAPERLVSTLHDAGRALERLLIAQTRASGLGMLELMVLSRAAEGAGVTPGEVGRCLGLSTSTMTGLADRLERDGLVRGDPHPTDGGLALWQVSGTVRAVMGAFDQIYGATSERPFIRRY